MYHGVVFEINRPEGQKKRGEMENKKSKKELHRKLSKRFYRKLKCRRCLKRTALDNSDYCSNCKMKIEKKLFG